MCVISDNIGFAEVFLECPLEEALRRNKTRKTPVEEHVIRNMGSKFEGPTTENAWEMHCVTVNTATGSNTEH